MIDLARTNKFVKVIENVLDPFCTWFFFKERDIAMETFLEHHEDVIIEATDNKMAEKYGIHVPEQKWKIGKIYLKGVCLIFEVKQNWRL